MVGSPRRFSSRLIASVICPTLARKTGVPLIAFSAMIDSIADLRRRNAPFDGFIAKPVTPSELVRRVTAYFALLGSVRHARRPLQKRAAPVSTILAHSA